jgi:hypothetical protein
VITSHARAHTHIHTHTHTNTHTHTHSEVFALLSCTLQNVNYFLAGTVDDGATDRQTDRHAVWSTAPSAQASASALKRAVRRVVDYTKLNIHESGLLNNTMMIFFLLKLVR